MQKLFAAGDGQRYLAPHPDFALVPPGYWSARKRSGDWGGDRRSKFSAVSTSAQEAGVRAVARVWV